MRTAQSMMTWKIELESQKNAEAELEDGNSAFGRCLRLQREVLRTVLMLDHELFNGGKPWLGLAKENLDTIRLLLMDDVKELANRTT